MAFGFGVIATVCSLFLYFAICEVGRLSRKNRLLKTGLDHWTEQSQCWQDRATALGAEVDQLKCRVTELTQSQVNLHDLAHANCEQDLLECADPDATPLEPKTGAEV